VKIFGRAGIELIPILVGLSENVAKAKEMGLGLDERRLKGSTTPIRNWRRLQHGGLSCPAAEDHSDARSGRPPEVDSRRWRRQTGSGHGDDKGPMTPGEKEVQRYLGRAGKQSQGKADDLRAQIATYGNRTDPEALSHLATLWTQLATQDDLAGGSGKRILDKALAGTGGGVDAQLAAARKALEGVQGEARGMDQNKQALLRTRQGHGLASRGRPGQGQSTGAEKQASEDEKKASANALAEERKRSTGIGAMSNARTSSGCRRSEGDCGRIDAGANSARGGTTHQTLVWQGMDGRPG